PAAVSVIERAGAAGEALAALEAAAGRTACLLVHPPVRAELVVLLPLLRIAEDFVRLVDLLELRLGGLVPWVHVRMMLARQLPERLLDFLVGGGLRHAEGGVVVFEVHRVSRSRASVRFLPAPAPSAGAHRASASRPAPP